jgi:uncharacterized membrane protein YdjX (TVP38/TMEM64 family)
MKVTSVITLVVFVLFCFLVYWWREPILGLTEHLDDGGVLGYSIYLLLLVGAVVFMPLSTIPLIPVAAMTFGPLITALLSIVGWTVGAVIAFLIAKYVGRPILINYISFQKVDELTKNLTPKTRFWGIVILRHIFPVDILSYAIGLTLKIGILEYTLATMIGVSWFSFAFAYGAEALIKGNQILIISWSVLSIIIFIGASYLYLYNKNTNNDNP